MNQHTDQYYIEKIIKGDANAFSILVERYQDMVFSITLKMMGSREEAEDVAQETFIKSYRSLSKFKGDARFSTWLYRICYNLCIDKLKARKRWVFTEQVDTIKEEESLSLNTDAFQQLVMKERSELLKNAIAKLKEDDQILITLYYFEELSIKEIGDIVGISPNNVKIKLYRCRTKLVSLLQGSMSSIK